MVRKNYTKDDLMVILSGIPDPEIPVVSIHEMGMLRNINLTKDGCEVIITPTYTGCPAMHFIEEDIKTKLTELGVKNVSVKMVYAPAWTTDWMSDTAKEKLRLYGIAPPLKTACNTIWLGASGNIKVKCPYCNSSETGMISHFGSTACKALYKCESCKEPFEYFKCH